MARGMANEVKTGLLIIFAVAILAVFTLALGNFMGFENTYTIKAQFNWISGLEKHAPVRLRGVEAGEVSDIEIIYQGDDTKVILTLALKESVKVRQGTKAYVSMLGLMGEKYIELSDGPKGMEFLKPGSLVIGQDPVSMEDIMDIGKKMAEQVEGAMAEIRTLAKDLDQLVVDNRQDIDSMIDRLNSTASNFEEFSAEIKTNPWKLLHKPRD